jgi:hypothetical protein
MGLGEDGAELDDYGGAGIVNRRAGILNGRAGQGSFTVNGILFGPETPAISSFLIAVFSLSC